MWHYPGVAFTVLVICTGNICRSPLGERMLRAVVPAGADVVVTSAGTHGLTGRPIDHDSAIALRELGIEPDGHRARRLDLRLLGAADLILTATLAHRGIVLAAEPLLLTKAFTLREFGRLATLPPQLPSVAGPVPTVTELRARVAAVAARRGQGEAVVNDDIADPYGGSLKAARTAAAEIAAATTAIAAGLGFALPPPAHALSFGTVTSQPTVGRPNRRGSHRAS